MTPVDRQVEMLKYVFPDAKNLGTVYNAGELIRGNQRFSKSCL